MKCSLEDPYDFIKQERCKLALLEVKSSRSDVINKDKLIKGNLIHSLPRANRDGLELFKEANIPLTQFMDKFSHERATAQAQEGAVRTAGKTSDLTQRK